MTYTLLDISVIFQFISAIKYSLLVSLVLNKLTNYGRRHFKQFTNCHVLWDTLFIEFHFKPCPSIVKNNSFYSIL